MQWLKMFRRTHKGLVLIGIVAFVLLAAPTIAFWLQEGFEAVVAYWISVVLLAALAVYGVYLLATDKAALNAPKTPYQKGIRVKRRAHAGFALLSVVGLILVVAPTVVFWARYGFEAVFAHWAAVVFLGVLLVSGVYMVLTDRLRDSRRNEPPSQ